MVAALCEWVVSKNMKQKDNLAVYYIDKMQANPIRLEIINRTVNKYNLALSYYRQGNEDMAVIQLKKLLSQMLDELEEKNKTESEIKLSTAYGYAMSGETGLKQDFSDELKIKVVDINPRTIYRIADDRMYENKRKSKLGRQ